VGERPLREKAVDDRSGRELKFAEGLAEGSRSPPSSCFFLKGLFENPTISI